MSNGEKPILDTFDDKIVTSATANSFFIQIVDAADEPTDAALDRKGVYLLAKRLLKFLAS